MRRHLVAVVFLLAFGVVVVDQVTKFLAVAQLSEGEQIALLGNVLGLSLQYNSGAAFSFATGMTWVFTLIAAVVVVVVVRLSRRIGSAWWAVSLGLLLGGAVGNLIDRLVRDPGFGRGHVVDFINYAGWFVGNVADIAIVLAAVGVGVLAVVGVDIEGEQGHDAVAHPRGHGRHRSAALDAAPVTETSDGPTENAADAPDE